MRKQSLEILNLQNRKVAGDNLAHLLDCLKENSSIRKLNISKNAFPALSENFSEALKEFVEQNKRVEELRVQSCGIEEKKKKIILNSLKKNKTLTILNLEFSEFSEECAHTLVEAMRKQKFNGTQIVH